MHFNGKYKKTITEVSNYVFKNYMKYASIA